jgi:NAD(P)-dependent dehydrogenase (short-subunit alcohol dehydrogenase family)
MATQDRQVVIVTGASQGIGAGIVAGYRDKGWSVVATSRIIEATGDPAIHGVAGDISDPATAERIVGEALEAFGRIDTLVNNAGVYLSKPFIDYTADDYAAIVGVNLTGFFRLTQLAITHMLERGTGHVVNITTTLVDVADSTAPSALTALTKGGVAAVTRSLAIEHAARGVRVNAVSPGIIQTPVHPSASYAGLGERLVPLGHVGQVDDIVTAILFLEASPFITGEIVHVDGGQIAGH